MDWVGLGFDPMGSSAVPEDMAAWGVIWCDAGVVVLLAGFSSARSCVSIKKGVIRTSADSPIARWSSVFHVETPRLDYCSVLYPECVPSYSPLPQPQPDMSGSSGRKATAIHLIIGLHLHTLDETTTSPCC